MWEELTISVEKSVVVVVVALWYFIMTLLEKTNLIMHLILEFSAARVLMNTCRMWYIERF